MPIQAPQWTDYLNCPICCREFGAPPRSPISLGCGHTFCKHCINNLHRKQCPFDQAVIQVEPDELVINTALLKLAGITPPSQPYHPPSILALSDQDRRAYDVIVRCMEHLAVYLKYCGNGNNSVAASRLSRPMQRKLVTLLQCPMTDEEGRGKAARAARSLGERTLTELLLQHQNPQQLSANLWAAVRARGCQFLGPAMQEEVLKLVLLALEDGSALSRKVLVMFVVQRLEPHFPQASKTSIGHVVQLLYRASCFKVSKRECNSSLMQLKEEFRTYDSLRREHDAQIVQIATEAGLRIAPDQWSALLYGDTVHKSHMQSIIDKLQSPQSFAQSVQELYIALQRIGDPAQLAVMSMHLDRLANIDSSPDAKCPSWQKLAEIMTSLKDVVTGLVQYLQQQNATGKDANQNQKYNIEPSTSQTIQISSLPAHGKFEKFDMARCGDSVKRTLCPKGAKCPLIHTDDDLESYKVVLVDTEEMRRNRNMTNGNIIPTIIIEDTTLNEPQAYPEIMHQDMPQFVPRAINSQSMSLNVPQTIYEGVPHVMNPEHSMRMRVPSFALPRGYYRGNVEYLPSRPPPLYPQYRLPHPQTNVPIISAPSQMTQPSYSEESTVAQAASCHQTEQRPGLYQSPPKMDYTNQQVFNYMGQCLNQHQRSVYPGPMMYNDAEKHNMLTVPMMPHNMHPAGTSAYQFQDVPENADIIIEVPNYVTSNPKSEASGCAPWSPAIRQYTEETLDEFNNSAESFDEASNNNTLPDDQKIVGSNRDFMRRARPEHETLPDDQKIVGSNRDFMRRARPEHENPTWDDNVVGSKPNLPTDPRSEDEDLKEELVALQSYLSDQIQ